MFVTIARMPDGLTIDSVLKPGTTWRARCATGTRVVLKKLPDDCLPGGKLHPAIRLRLTRLREAPMSGLANVIGVEHTEVGVVVVNEYVCGQSLDRLPMEQRAAFIPDARRLVEALHRVGLVHGAIGPGNFVIERGGRLRLIDPSPLLYDDPRVDLDAIARLEPDDAAKDAHDDAPRWHRPSLAAASLLTFAAVAAAACWAFHMAGRS